MINIYFFKKLLRRNIQFSLKNELIEFSRFSCKLVGVSSFGKQFHWCFSFFIG